MSRQKWLTMYDLFHASNKFSGDLWCCFEDVMDQDLNTSYDGVQILRLQNFFFPEYKLSTALQSSKGSGEKLFTIL